MGEVRDILKSVGVTAVYVTHDQAEAFAIADRVVVMNRGHIEQSGPPEEIYRSPATPFVARFLGLRNLAEGQVLGPNRVASPWGELAVATEDYAPGQAVTVLIRPEAARLYQEKGEGGLSLPGTLVDRSFRGGRYQIQIQPDPGPALTFDLTTVAPLSLASGDPLTLSLDPAGIVLLPR